jgi:hypothetical protein
MRDATRAWGERAAAPAWWSQTRSLYAPAAAGAGSALMSFALRADGNEVGGWQLGEHLRSFTELPRLLDDARKLGCSTLYLADYWEGGYFHKGDYVPAAAFGGPQALRAGVDAVHERGGRVLLYLEAFICSRDSVIGKAQGPSWAMTNWDGSYQGYQNLDLQYYQMWPGRGSGWADYLAETGQRLVREYGVDGFHLDSYGCQWGWHSHQPHHRDAKEPGEFAARAADLTRTFTAAVGSARADTVVMMEGSDLPALLAGCHGSQDWCVAAMERKPWIGPGGFKVFCSEFGLSAMEQILARGADVSLSPWWLEPLPDPEQVAALAFADVTPDNASWAGQARVRAPIRDLWKVRNALVANGMAQPGELDFGWLRDGVLPFPVPVDAGLGTDAGRERWRRLVADVAARYACLDRTHARPTADYLREMIRRAPR